MTTTPFTLDSIGAGHKVPLSIPSEFGLLNDIAYNVWWSWRPDAGELFRRINSPFWSTHKNPLALLQTVEPSTWETLSGSEDFQEIYSSVSKAFLQYLEGNDTWYAQEHPDALAGPVAYLCAEFGIHHKLRTYSGGLGVLAGDHVKAASDLGIPLVAVGLLYRRGYFQQAVDHEGYQQHTYIPVEIERRPLRAVLHPRTGQPLRVSVPMLGREVTVAAWRVDVGRVPVLLLDTDIPENDPADRPITHILYVRGRDMRLAQEIVLGIGAVRVLTELGITPAAWHVNEGHAALSLVERLSNRIQAGENLDTAKSEVARSTLFTLHTPIPAGNEVFDHDLMRRYLSGGLPHIDDDLLTSLSASQSGGFDMGALAIRLSAITNGVSQRHGEVVTREWSELIGGPAKAITNGIHPQTWVGNSMTRLYRKTVGADVWDQTIIDPDAWKSVRDIPAEELWAAHNTAKSVVLKRLRSRMLAKQARHGVGPDRLRAIESSLPDDRLTIAFARRFATYKRAGLIFSDPNRIKAILTNPEMPVQIVFAGKAHPADREGQGLVKWVFDMSQSADLAGHVFFIENYDMELGSDLVRGADVWLNNPIPPQEASGTSGMKAAANGAINLSQLDGWWAEGFNGNNGWGFGEVSYSDAEDAGLLYHLLETEVVPMYYERDEDGVPQRWVEMMKESIVSALPQFSTQRMLVDYAEQAYLPLGRE